MKLSPIVIVAVLGLTASPATADHDGYERSRCYEGDCGSYYDDGGGSSGGRYEGGRSGDTDQRGNDNCRNACGNTIIVPSPGGREEQGDETES